MPRSSQWLNYPTSALERRFAFSDSLAALKAGAWQDATKLFSIEGRVYGGPATLRHQLTFYECAVCREHAAILATYTCVSQGTLQEPVWELDSQATIVRAGHQLRQLENALRAVPGRVRAILNGAFRLT